MPVCAHFVAIRQMIGHFNGNTNLFPNKQEKFNQIMDINTKVIKIKQNIFVFYLISICFVFLGYFSFCCGVSLMNGLNVFSMCLSGHHTEHTGELKAERHTKHEHNQAKQRM